MHPRPLPTYNPCAAAASGAVIAESRGLLVLFENKGLAWHEVPPSRGPGQACETGVTPPLAVRPENPLRPRGLPRSVSAFFGTRPH